MIACNRQIEHPAVLKYRRWLDGLLADGEIRAYGGLRLDRCQVVYWYITVDPTKFVKHAFVY